MRGTTISNLIYRYKGELLLASVILGGLQAGVEITGLQDTTKAEEIEAWIEQFSSVWNILPIGAKSFRHWARLMHGGFGDLIEDALIAAIAHAHDLTVVTRAVRDFAPPGVRTLDPFASV
jgi:toxin FitB